MKFHLITYGKRDHDYIQSLFFLRTQIHTTTADGTRSVVKKNNIQLIPHELITYPSTRTRTEKTPGLSNMTEAEMNSMTTRQLHSSQKEALKKISEFSGESNELDVDEWLFDLTNLFTIMQLNDETKILETMGKLAGPALRWYQENLTSFVDWAHTESALKDRFKEHTSDSQLMQELFQIHQEENQSVTSFYENVIRKYRKARKFITEQQVITVLQSGVKNSLKEHLIRNEKGIQKPDEWLKIAREEEFIQKRLQQRNNLCPDTKSQPVFEPALPTVAIQSRLATRSTYQNTQTARGGGQYQQRQSRKFGENQMGWKTNNHQGYKQGTYMEKNTRNADSCLICNRKNHPTTQCYYKKESGCYKCGQSNHRIRDCPKRHFFE